MKSGAKKSPAKKGKKVKLSKQTVKDLDSKKDVKGGQLAATNKCRSIRWCQD